MKHEYATVNDLLSALNAELKPDSGLTGTEQLRVFSSPECAGFTVHILGEQGMDTQVAKIDIRRTELNTKPVITAVAFSKELNSEMRREVYATFDNSLVDEILFTYFDDELEFTEQELIGLTAEEAADLYRTKDIAYIQS